MIWPVGRRSASAVLLSWKFRSRSANSLKISCSVFSSAGLVVTLVELRFSLSSCLRQRLSRRSCFRYSVVESDVNVQRGGKSVSGIILQTVCCIPNIPRYTCLSENPGQIETRKRNMGVDRNESTYSTTTQRLHLNDDTRSCRS